MATSSEVAAAYKDVLKRDVDPSGLKTYTSNNMSADQVRADLAKSAEYARRFGGSTSAAKTTSLTDFASQQAAQFQKLLAQQKKEQEKLFKKYEAKIGSQEKLTDAYGRMQGEYGVPELEKQAGVFKEQIFTVKNLLDRLDEDVSTRTKDYLVNEAQKNRQIAAEGGELRTQLGRLGTGLEPVSEMLSTTQSKIATALGLLQEDQQKELQPLIMRIESLGDRFSREITGFTASSQNQLSALLDQIQRDRDLSDRDWELAQTLAAEERQWARTKANISTGIANNSTAVNQLVELLKNRTSVGSGGPNTSGGSKTAEDMDSLVRETTPPQSSSSSSTPLWTPKPSNTSSLDTSFLNNWWNKDLPSLLRR
jgi:hypothetical protein